MTATAEADGRPGRRASLAVRVLVPIALTLVVASLVSGFLVAEHVRSDAIERHADRVAEVADHARELLDEAGWPTGAADGLDARLAEFVARALTPAATYAVTGPGGAVIAGASELPDLAVGAVALETQTAQGRMDEGASGTRMIATVPLARQGEDGYVLHVAEDARPVVATASNARRTVFAAGAIALVMMAAGLLPLLRNHERALEERTRAVQNLLEREQAQRRELAEVDAMKTAFLTAVSHELRTPLTVIKGMSKTVGARAEMLPPETIAEMMGRIDGKVDRLDLLLGDLLDIDRLARGVLEPRRRPMDLRDIVDNVVREMDAGDHRLHLPEAGRVAHVDPGHVERIVENLLRNALQYTPAGANVWVRVGEHESETLLVVEDDGPGIPDADKQSMFKPLLGGNPDAANPGLGSGLALVQRLAEIHGGGAWIEDRPGGGTSVHVRLPDA